MDNEPALPDGIEYGGRGPGGEFFSKDINELHSASIWTEGEESFTGDELIAIGRYKKWLEERGSVKPERTYCSPPPSPNCPK